MLEIPKGQVDREVAIRLGGLVAGELNEYFCSEQLNEMRAQVSNDPRLCVLQGGRMMLNLSSFDKMLVTKEEYQEIGENVVN